MLDTIFAPITGRGGAVSIIRISGERTFEILQTLMTQLPRPRAVSLKPIRYNKEILDHALITIFPAPRSFTGEDCAELGLHGGRAVLTAVSNALTSLGARYAEPGEFSRRAHANGKLDLLAAEAMADLIAAETEAQRRLALQGADELQRAAALWRERLRQIMAKQEALIDFPDEDLPPEVEAALVENIQALRGDLAASLAAAPAATRLREGLEFVILGAPNTGKSTLLNALAGEDIAIVSDVPGTTRDAIGIRVDLAGIPIRLTDTAGLRDSSDIIEQEGVKRAGEAAKRADLIIAVAAAPNPSFSPIPPGIQILHVITKSDLFEAPPIGFLNISAQTGTGMEKLRAALAAAAARLTETSGTASLARPRQIACVRDTLAALTAAIEATEPELRGEDLRAAAISLSRLVGTLGVEEILEAVFSGFCIGK